MEFTDCLVCLIFMSQLSLNIYILLLFDWFLTVDLKCEIESLELANTSMIEKCTVKDFVF